MRPRSKPGSRATGKRPFGRLPLLGALLAATGCASANLTYNHYFENYDPSMLSYAAGQGALYTQIFGNPFDVPKQQLEQKITDTMYGSHFGPRVPFVTQRPTDYKSPYRVVILFNPASNLNAAKICRQEAVPSAAQPGVVRILGALCSNEDRETSVVGEIAGVTGPDDPAFRQLIRQITTLLLPRTNPLRRADREGNTFI